jgi:CheY-like chemotaxis protein
MNEAGLIGQLRQRKPWILLLDDDLHITQGLKDILEDSGYHVEITHSGGEAIQALNEQSFSVLVVDYSLPDTNGIELTRKLRADHPNLQVLLMTGHDRFEMQPHDMNDLFAAFLRKPVEVEAITKAIEDTVEKQCVRLNIPFFKNRPSDPILPAENILERRQPVNAFDRAASEDHFLKVIPVVALLLGLGAGWIAKGFYAAPSTFKPAPIAASPAPATVSTQTTLALLSQAREAPPTFVAEEKPEKKRVKPETKKPHPARHSTMPSVPALPPPPDFATRLTALKTQLKQDANQPKAVEVFISMMQDPLAAHRLAAIDTISAMRTSAPSAVMALGTRLGDEDASVSLAAATTLSHLGPAALPVLPQLIEALAYKPTAPQPVARAAAEAITQIGVPAVPGLLKQLDNLNLRRDILKILGRLGPGAAEASPAVMALLNDPAVGALAAETYDRIQGKTPDLEVVTPSVKSSSTTP